MQGPRQQPVEGITECRLDQKAERPKPLPIDYCNDDKRDEDQAQEGDLVRRSPELTLHAATPKTKSATARWFTRALPLSLRTYLGTAAGRLPQTGVLNQGQTRCLHNSDGFVSGWQLGNGISQSAVVCSPRTTSGDAHHNRRGQKPVESGLSEASRLMVSLTKFVIRSLEFATRLLPARKPKHLLT